MKFSAAVSVLGLYVCAAVAVPISKRFYQPTSPVFSLIAHHQGEVFEYNLVKFDGEDLLLNIDEPAFYGRIKANEGYTLNIPFGNSSNGTFSTNESNVTYPLPTNVYVDKNNKLTTSKNNTSSKGFGVNSALLTYQNSTKFLACPILHNTTESIKHNAKKGKGHHKSDKRHKSDKKHKSSSSKSSNSTEVANYTIPYDIYFKGNSTGCPNNVTGYEISLIVQLASTINFSPDTNVNSSYKRQLSVAPQESIQAKRSLWSYLSF